MEPSPFLHFIQYLHSAGIIHNDLRPRNFLLDEYGILKLSDFKFATKIPKDPLGDAPLPQRGIPPFMAPELFTSEGVLSYSSDMWSLGIVLYQLRRGILPFGDTSYTPLDTIRDNIRNITDLIQFPVYPHLNMMPTQSNKLNANSLPSVSLELADLLLWLLEKAPMNRCNW